MPKKKKTKKDLARLRDLVAEATVDCYDENEQALGLVNMVADQVTCPFNAKVLGEEVRVSGFDSQGQSLVAICERKGKEYRINVDSLAWIEPYPEGFEWIEAYLAWQEWR